MVKIIDYKKRTNSEGESFFALIVQGGLEIAQSKESGKLYATGKTASLVSSFPEDYCRTLIGTEIPGTIQKVQCKPFEVANSETGEVVLRDYRYEYVAEGDPVEPEPVEEPEEAF